MEEPTEDGLSQIRLKILKDKRVLLDELEDKIEEMLCDFEKKHSGNIVFTPSPEAKRTKLGMLIEWETLTYESEIDIPKS